MEAHIGKEITGRLKEIAYEKIDEQTGKLVGSRLNKDYTQITTKELVDQLK